MPTSCVLTSTQSRTLPSAAGKQAYLSRCILIRRLVTVVLEKLTSVEDRDQTDRVTKPTRAGLRPLTLTYDLFDHRRAVVMIHAHGQTQVQSSVGSKERVETNGRLTDRRTDRRTAPIALRFRLTRPVNISSSRKLHSFY